MSVVPLGGLIGSATGTPMAQTQGSEVERDQRESAAQARKVDLADQSERAQGVGQTKEDHDISERDADGRRPSEGGCGQRVPGRLERRLEEEGD